MPSKEDRAEIARRNGAKSRGPVTPEGKDRSRRNAITHGRRAEALKWFVPPHSAVLAIERRKEFYDLLEQHIAFYKPVGDIEYAIVRQIVDASWNILRAESIQTHTWNRELLVQPELGPNTDPALAHIETVSAAAEGLANRKDKTLRLCERSIDRMHNLISKCERRLARLRRDFRNPQIHPATSRDDRELFHCPAPERPPQAHNERTNPAAAEATPQTVANTAQHPETAPENREKHIVFADADTPEIRAMYEYFFPGCDFRVRPREEEPRDDAAPHPQNRPGKRAA